MKRRCLNCGTLINRGCWCFDCDFVVQSVIISQNNVVNNYIEEEDPEFAGQNLIKDNKQIDLYDLIWKSDKV